MASKEHDFSVGSIPRNIISLALPMTAAQLINVLYSVVDRIYLGRLPGHLALTGLGLTLPIISIVMGFANLCGMGGAPLCSIHRGKGENEEAERILGNSFTLLLLFGGGLTVFCLAFRRPILYLFGASDLTFPYANDYLTIYLLGTLFVMIGLGMNPFINAQGFSRMGMMTVALGAAVNIVLDPIFIFALDMGVRGAALATVVSQGISVLLCILYIVQKVPVLVPWREDWKLYAHETREQLRMGVPMALQFSITASGIMIAQAAINLFGSTAAAAYTAASKVSMLLTQGCLSMGQTMATYAGQNFGKGDLGRIREGVKKGLRMMALYSLLAAVVLHYLLPFLTGFFFSGDVDAAALLPWARTYGGHCHVVLPAPQHDLHLPERHAGVGTPWRPPCAG